MNDKLILRKKFLKIRNNISAEKRKLKSHCIFKKLIEMDEYKNSKIIGLYFSFSSEVDTTEIIDFSLKCGKKVVIPKILDSNNMEFISIDFNYQEKLVKNKFNINELASNDFIKKNLIEMIIVPVVVFDNQNNRIGYGKGFYDKYLQDYKGFTIGLAFIEQKNSILINTDKFDVKLNKILCN